jgi:hypothetical protein
VFACGNALQVHDLVDFVSEESELTGKSAAEYVKNGTTERNAINCVQGKNINYVLPQKIDKNASGDVKLYFRVSNTFKNCTIKLECNGKEIVKKIKKVAAPGEMETLLLKESVIKELDGDVVLSLEESL